MLTNFHHKIIQFLLKQNYCKMYFSCFFCVFCLILLNCCKDHFFTKVSDNRQLDFQSCSGQLKKVYIFKISLILQYVQIYLAYNQTKNQLSYHFYVKAHQNGIQHTFLLLHEDACDSFICILKGLSVEQVVQQRLIQW